MNPRPESDPEALEREADRLLAATLYLMSCHARNGCPRLAYMVKRHFELIARHTETGELVADTCRRLASAWEAIGRHDLDAPGTPENPPTNVYETLRNIVH